MNATKQFLVIMLFCSLTLFTLPALSQSTISTGSIQGTITDPQEAVLSGVSVTITNKANGQTVKLTSSSTGSYATGAMQPGEYTVRMEAKGFRTEVVTV